jgi:hypothetical protein
MRITSIDKEQEDQRIKAVAAVTRWPEAVYRLPIIGKALLKDAEDVVAQLPGSRRICLDD